MPQGDEKESPPLKSIHYAIAGGVSGAVTRCICQPLDVLKIRFQLQIEPVCKGNCSKYHSMLQATKTIIKEEGITGMWKGHVPAQLLSIIYGVVQFTSYELVSATFSSTKETSPLYKFMCGAVAGSTATIISFPCDVIRTRLVSQGEPKIYKGVHDAVHQIYRNEGPRAFFKGLSPTILQIAPHTGAQFAFFYILKEAWGTFSYVADVHPHWTSALSSSLICGGLAGVGAKAIIFPFDLTRKRLQIQGFEEARKKFGKVFVCDGLMHCVWKTVKEEKVWGLYKGMTPGLIKAGSTTALHFALYELMCNILRS